MTYAPTMEGQSYKVIFKNVPAGKYNEIRSKFAATWT